MNQSLSSYTVPMTHKPASVNHDGTGEYFSFLLFVPDLDYVVYYPSVKDTVSIIAGQRKVQPLLQNRHGRSPGAGAYGGYGALF